MRRRRVLAVLPSLLLAGCQSRLSNGNPRRSGTKSKSSGTGSNRTASGQSSSSSSSIDHSATSRTSPDNGTNATGNGTRNGSGSPTNATNAGNATNEAGNATNAGNATAGNATNGSTSATGSDAPRVLIRIENISSKAANFGITVTHTSNPDCRYDTPACGRSTTENTVFDQAISVGARAAAELGPTEVPLTSNAVDLASVVATVKGQHATADGVEPGAKRVMGDKYDENNYDWKLTPVKHVARVQYDGGVVVVTMESP